MGRLRRRLGRTTVNRSPRAAVMVVMMVMMKARIGQPTVGRIMVTPQGGRLVLQTLQMVLHLLVRPLLHLRRKVGWMVFKMKRGDTTGQLPGKRARSTFLLFPKVVSGGPGGPVPSMPSSLPLGGRTTWHSNG